LSWQNWLNSPGELPPVAPPEVPPALPVPPVAPVPPVVPVPPPVPPVAGVVVVPVAPALGGAVCCVVVPPLGAAPVVPAVPPEVVVPGVVAVVVPVLVVPVEVVFEADWGASAVAPAGGVMSGTDFGTTSWAASLLPQAASAVVATNRQASAKDLVRRERMAERVDAI
jgi:hypothetical protein